MQKNLYCKKCNRRMKVDKEVGKDLSYFKDGSKLEFFPDGPQTEHFLIDLCKRCSKLLKQWLSVKLFVDIDYVVKIGQLWRRNYCGSLYRVMDFIDDDIAILHRISGTGPTTWNQEKRLLINWAILIQDFP